MIKNYLRRIAMTMPSKYHPFFKMAYNKAEIRYQSVSSRRKIHCSQRIVFLAPEIADIETYEFLSPGSGQVMVETAFNAVSVGTEMAQIVGTMPKPFPYWPGYSGSGVVVAVGKHVTGIKSGDAVAGQFKHAHRLVVDADKAFVLPDEVRMEEAAFIEIGIIVLQAIHKAAIRAGESALVIGQGIIGQMADRLARLSGAAPVFAAALSTKRESIALASGGADLFRLSGELDENLVEVVIESSGASAAFHQALRVAKPEGRVILLGSSRELQRDVQVQQYIQSKSLCIIGAHVSIMPKMDSSPKLYTYRQEGSLFVEFLQSQMLSIMPMITHTVHADKANALFEGLSNSTISPVGMLLDWNTTA
jgi:2-desacetyl-2-hydroxyethyl bacteriochlorophyllide A dehydrogenase